MSHRRRGQAALEFLTTYGWAFLVILIMMAAISYFGFLNPGKYLPKRCNVGSEFTCSDFQIRESDRTVYIKLTQNLGRTIYSDKVTCLIEGTAIDAEDTVLPAEKRYEWTNRELVEFKCTYAAADTFLEGQNVKILVEVSYFLEEGGYPHRVDGEIYTEVVQ